MATDFIRVTALGTLLPTLKLNGTVATNWPPKFWAAALPKKAVAAALTGMLTEAFLSEYPEAGVNVKSRWLRLCVLATPVTAIVRLVAVCEVICAPTTTGAAAGTFRTSGAPPVGVSAAPAEV